MGYPAEAMAILDAAITEFGEDDRFTAAKQSLQQESAPSAAPVASLVVDHVSVARDAVHGLRFLLPSQLGDVLGPPEGGLRGYLLREVSRAVASLQHMAAILRHCTGAAGGQYEDDLNTAVREVLNASLSTAGWNAADQSLGGVTANGNLGKRDAVICVSGQEICVYEALVCSGLKRTTIKSHFDKVLAYGTFDIYFHVVYSYAPDIAPLLDYVREMAEREVPSGLTFTDCTSIGPPDFETSGFVANYRMGHREIAVIFLVVDLLQGGQKSAIATPKSKRRRPTKAEPRS